MKVVNRRWPDGSIAFKVTKTEDGRIVSIEGARHPSPRDIEELSIPEETPFRHSDTGRFFLLFGKAWIDRSNEPAIVAARQERELRIEKERSEAIARANTDEALEAERKARAAKSKKRRALKAAVAVLAALVAYACGTGATADVTAPTNICTVTGAGATICGSGSITITLPAATPTPATGGGAPSCGKGIPAYEQNLIIAEQGIPAAQSMETYIVALTSALTKVGFKVGTGNGLPGDEIAVKITDSFSETYDVWRADGTPQVLYQATCSPARF